MGGVGVSPASLEGAGGVGGLLALEDVADPNDPNDNLSYVYLYDGNGNVGQLVDLNHDPNDPAGAIVASYEYDPYGNVTAKSGDYADANPFRFSTKYWDDETGLGYWGQRYYNPALGRWLNRDPIDELGGVNLYAYVGNDPIDNFDYLGELNCRRGEPCIFAHDDDYGGGGRCPKKGQSQWDPQPGESMGPLPPGWPTSPPICSDCSATCNSALGQASLGGQGGAVICRPDGCRCACVSNSQYPGGAPGSSGEIKQRCALKHEEDHVNWGSGAYGALCTSCKPLAGGLLPIQGTSLLCGGGRPGECHAYQAQVDCLMGALTECQTASCRDELIMDVYTAEHNKCSQGCRKMPDPAIMRILTPDMAEALRNACTPNLPDEAFLTHPRL
jgi:RHS repeat-associated protein